MYAMYICNTAENRKALKELGLLSEDRDTVSFIAVDILKNHASYTDFVFTCPLFKLSQVLNVIYLPTYEARVFYLLEEGIINRFNRHVDQGVIAKYYQYKNSKN